MKILYTLILVVLFASCSKQEIKLPLIAEKGQEEILNHSQIWMFFEEKEGDTVLVINKNNLIKSTNWIFNIDKHFTLKQIFPDLEKYKVKHFKEGMHKSKDSIGNYFSYANSIDKKLSFLNFTNTKYQKTKEKFEDLVQSNIDSSFFQVPILVSRNSIQIQEKKVLEAEFKSELQLILDKSSRKRKAKITLFFKEDISYDTYLIFKTHTNSFEKIGVTINPVEYILE